MILEAHDIEKWFFRGRGSSNRFFAVERTNLSLEPGMVTVLTGRSGSGKTTLMNMLAGLLSPDNGTVMADGQDLYRLSDAALSRLRNQHFGMIPQGADLFPELTVMENILLPQGIICPVDPDIEKNACILLEQMNILPLERVFAKELSGGERRRVCVARALAGKPEIIFADEPTSELDDENVKVVLSVLRQAADDGAAVMIVTHDREALDYADVTARMDGGKIL